MSFPRYPSYKDSGVEWLGHVPAHWEVVPLKAAANVAVSGIDKKSKDDEERIRFLGTDTVYSSERITASTELEECTASDDQVRSFSLHAEDVVITKDSVVPTMIAVASYVEQSPARAVCGYHLALLRSHPERAVGLFLFYSLKSTALASYFLSAARGTTIIGIGAGIIGRAAIPLPPVQEQTAIAEFLDRETGKIDELVVEQRRLMELLKEKRQAVISHAVTRGLTPAAPLKPSGIEWLGDVPAHWTVIPIRLVAKLESGHTPSRQHPEYWENCTVPWFSLSDVWQIREAKAEYIFETKEKVSELGLAKSSARLLPKDTVMLSRTASVGFSAIMGVDMATTQDFANWICGPRLQPEFLLYAFRSMEGEFRRLMMGSTHNTIYMPDIQSLRFVLPPRDEQAEIVKYVRKMAGEFDTLTTEAQRAIDLLQERRTALISAAVTGQIDVRADDPDDFAIVLRLPPLAAEPPLLEDRINGVPEMQRFWETGDPMDLPENPDVVVVMDWLNRMAEVGGFERSLEHLRLTHQDVVDTVLQPAENGNLKPLRAAHPLVLMQCLWRIGVQIERTGYNDMRRPILSEKPAAAGEFWRELRKKLVRGQERPCLMFATAGR